MHSWISPEPREIFKRIYFASQIWLISLVQLIASPPDIYLTKLEKKKKKKNPL